MIVVTEDRNNGKFRVRYLRHQVIFSELPLNEMRYVCGAQRRFTMLFKRTEPKNNTKKI